MHRTIAAAGALLAAGLGLLAAPAAQAEPTYTMSVTPTSVQPGTTLNIRAIDPCPAPPATSNAFASVVDDDADTPKFLDAKYPTVDADGRWAVTLQVPASVGRGHHLTVHAACHSFDSAGSLHVIAVYQEERASVAPPRRVVPDPVDDSLTTRQDTALPIVSTQLLANDPRDGGWICQVGQAAHGHIAPGGGSGEWTYTPARAFHGADSFSYRLCQSSDGNDVASNRAATVRVAVTVPDGAGRAPSSDPNSTGARDPGDVDPGPGDPGVGDPRPGADPTDSGAGSGEGTGTGTGSGSATPPASPTLSPAASARHHDDADDTVGIVIVGIAAALVCAIAGFGAWYWRRSNARPE